MKRYTRYEENLQSFTIDPLGSSEKYDLIRYLKKNGIRFEEVGSYKLKVYYIEEYGKNNGGDLVAELRKIAKFRY